MALETDSASAAPLAPSQPPSREPKVAVLYTSAPTVIRDVARGMELAGFRDHLPADRETLLKVNISWQHYYPGCSTSPWQLDGVAQALHDAGFGNITPVQNGTVVVDSTLR